MGFCLLLTFRQVKGNARHGRSRHRPKFSSLWRNSCDPKKSQKKKCFMLNFWKTTSDSHVFSIWHGKSFLDNVSWKSNSSFTMIWEIAISKKEMKEEMKEPNRTKNFQVLRSVEKFEKLPFQSVPTFENSTMFKNEIVRYFCTFNVFTWFFLRSWSCLHPAVQCWRASWIAGNPA